MYTTTEYVKVKQHRWRSSSSKSFIGVLTADRGTSLLVLFLWPVGLSSIPIRMDTGANDIVLGMESGVSYEG